MCNCSIQSEIGADEAIGWARAPLENAIIGIMTDSNSLNFHTGFA